MMTAVTHPMWSLLFRSKATIQTALAVERTRRELLEQENRELRERLVRAETEKARLIDAVLLKQGSINAPLHTEKRTDNPIATYITAMGVQEIDGKTPVDRISQRVADETNSHLFSAPSMPDE